MDRSLTRLKDVQSVTNAVKKQKTKRNTNMVFGKALYLKVFSKTLNPVPSKLIFH